MPEHNLSRRDFIKLAAVEAGYLALQGLKRPVSRLVGEALQFGPGFQAFVSNYEGVTNLLMIKDFSNNEVYVSIGQVEPGETPTGLPATLFKEITNIEEYHTKLKEKNRSVDLRAETPNLNVRSGFEKAKPDGNLNIVTVWADMFTGSNPTPEELKAAEAKLVEYYRAFGIQGMDSGNGRLAFPGEASIVETKDLTTGKTERMVFSVRVPGTRKVVDAWELKVLEPVADPQIGFSTKFDERTKPQDITIAAPTPAAQKEWVAPVPNIPAAEASLTPEEQATAIEEWNKAFEGIYRVDMDGGFFAVDKKTGVEMPVEKFWYDPGLGVLWRNKFSFWLNKDINLPITLAEMDLVEKPDGTLTGDIDLPAAKLIGKTLAVEPETIYFSSEQVETIPKAEAMLVLNTWMKEIYQATLEAEGLEAAEATLGVNNPVENISPDKTKEYFKIGQSNGKMGIYMTLFDGTVFDSADSRSDYYSWFNNVMQLTDKKGRLVKEISVPFMTVTSSDDLLTGLVLAKDPAGNIQKLFVDYRLMYQFNYDEWKQTKLTKMQMPEALWQALTSQ